MLKTTIIAAATLAAVAATAAPAQAYWVRGYGWGWRPPVVIAPIAIVPPPPVFVGPPRRGWVPAHYNAYGYYVPGHWR